MECPGASPFFSQRSSSLVYYPNFCPNSSSMFSSIPLFQLVSQPFKRAQLGLFQGKTKQYGNSVPFSKHKTRRSWLPNIQNKRLFSEALGKNIQIKVTTRALKTIKKHGGIDNYLLKTKPELLGIEGMRYRLMVREKKESLEAEESSAVDIEALLASTPAPSTATLST
ncbi:hypothetical protein C8Q75DRAFT_251642 [Abortiporus biennis]|nr:hypothetical protein C8Q75DRAFT_251642 [Abortiporus biennis]